MLRNPADRAFSLYQWMIKEGYEWAPTFKDALRMEKDRRNSVSFVKENPEYFYNFLYRTSGCYARQVDRFLDVFDREQMRFLIFEDFVSSPASCTREIFRFFGIDDSVELNTPVRNKGKSVRSVTLQFWLCRYARPISLKVPFGLRVMRKAMQWNTTPKKKTLSDSCRRNLVQYYEEDIRKTGELIERDLVSYWL